MKAIGIIYRYLVYLLRSKTKHGVHSPFVYKLLTDVIQAREEKFYAYDKIEYLRSVLLKNNKEINITDLGAGSKINSSRRRKISDIAISSAKPAKYAQLLFRLVNFQKPKTIIELGTSLGISTAYLASPFKTTEVISLEGCNETAAIAAENFRKLGLQNIKLITGNFDATFPGILKSMESVDFVFIDGNHTKEATLRYFNACLEKAHTNTVLIFDDIHWSVEMEEAWKIICSNEKLSASIDLFFIGLVFFRTGQVKEHFVLRF
jgi:predicted O-methyltransferase YrrM